MITYLLDTNICIYIIKRKPLHVFEKFKTLTPGMVGISSITAAELLYGVSKSSVPERNHDALQQFFIPREIVPFDYVAAEFYGKLRSKLEKKKAPQSVRWIC